MEIIEKKGEFSSRFSRWSGNAELSGYPFIDNDRSPFTPVRRSLPMLNLALITSAGAYINGTDPFDTDSKDGDLEFRELPKEIRGEDLLFSAKGYDPQNIRQDLNVQIPLDRLYEYELNNVIGNLNEVWWSLSSHIPNAARVADELTPKLVERLQRYSAQAALLIPASRLCHQTLSLVARGLEIAGIPTMMLSVEKGIVERVRPPRAAYYSGKLGSVVGKANWPEYQLRILDEALRWTETFDQPTAKKLAVDLETETQAARGER